MKHIRYEVSGKEEQVELLEIKETASKYFWVVMNLR